LQNNYFHSVFEASKSLVKRIQELSCCHFDGQNLVEKVFKDNEPILIINKYQSRSEEDEHKGFRSMLIGIVSMFRNTEAHELRIEWNLSEQDALEILSIISYCHRRLDKAQKVR
jgi:TIGR02391 family protein